ncbi:MAG: hypothetical protein ACRC7C_19655 [Beijerinckiaceae bacterium]
MTWTQIQGLTSGGDQVAVAVTDDGRIKTDSGSGSATDRELVVTTYLCKSAFAGASAGDTITSTQIIDVTGAPSTVSTVWRNQTAATDLAGAPSAANLELVGSQALSDAQLRAAPLSVAVEDGPLETTQMEILTHLLDLDDGVGATSDDAATSDDGTFSLIAFIKRGLQNWTSLLARIPPSVGGTVPVSGPLTDAELRASAVPISASSLPLPSGAATSAGLTTLNSTLGTPMQQTGGTVGLVAGAATIGSVNVLGGNAIAVKVDSSAVTQPVSIADTVAVSAASLPLPTGAATEATAAGIRTDLGADGATPPALPGGATGVRGWLRGVYNLLSGTLAVSGTFWQATQPVSAAALPLPTGAASETTSAGIRTDLGADGAAPPALPGGATGVRGWLRGIYAQLTGTIAVSGTFWQATQPISATALPLPTGAAAEATLVAASAKLPATLGQKTRTASLAVVVASDQSSLPVTHLTTQRTAGLIRVTGAGTVAAGARSVSFANTGSANATVTGAATILKAGEIVSFLAQTNDTLGAIAYSGTGTEVLIAEVR